VLRLSKPRQTEGRRLLFALQRLFEKLKYPPITTAQKLFDIMILPVLSYGCELRGQALNPELEAIEIHFLKHILKLPQSATNMAVRGELGAVEGKDVALLE